VVRGEAGIGKTALLEDAAGQVRGMTVLRTRGVESEAELPYAGLLTLARPVLTLSAELPEAQSAALRAALALGPAEAAEPLAVCAATLGLLAAAAEREPLLVLVDDAHWLDRETAQAIGFAARRLADERVAVLIAVREAEQSAFDSEHLDELPLAGLDVRDATQLLGGRVVDPVARRLAGVTSGNPLALLEIVDTLSDGQRAGLEPVSEPLPVGAALERAFGRRIGGLDPAAQAVLVVAAAAGERDDVRTLRDAWARLGAGPGEVEHAERARLISVEGGQFRFRHPLVRAAVYAQAAPPERRAAHAALASALDAETAADERAWHVALAAVAPDEEAAVTIEAAGRRAGARSRHAALRALARAAELTPDGDAKTVRTLAATHAAVEAGAWDEATGLLGMPAVASAAGRHAIERLYLQAVVAGRRGGGPAAAELLERAACELAPTSPDRAAAALVQAAQAWAFAVERERALRAVEQAAALPFARGGKAELSVLLVRGDTAGWIGRFDEAEGFWRQAAALVDEGDPDQLQMAGEALFSAGDDDGALVLLRRAEASARERSALGTLTTSLQVLGLSETRAGNLERAYVAAAECVALMRALGQQSEQAEALALLSWVEAILGRAPECRQHVAEAHALLRGLEVAPPYGASGVGLLELSLGQPERAVESLSGTILGRSDRLDAEVIAPRPILPALVEALARAGRSDDAQRLLGHRLELARGTERPHAIAPLLRCTGLLRAEEDAFREALVWHDRWSNRWERARTELCYGELLRRRKRRAEARVLLRAARDGFDSVGAVLWAERACAELAMTGERARRRDPSTADVLTPQELHVARLVSTGLTNREVAARLFLSPKTIETHLAHVFRKTGVRTRAELAHRFRDSPDSIVAPAS
jgi:DNA-binding CsgD family transcriptional regulator